MIRDLVDADLERVLEINQANVPEVGWADRARLDVIVGQAVAPLVVEVDDVVVGFCLVLAPGADYDSINYGWFAERHPSAWYLDRVAFDAAAQGRGFGSELYAEVERRWQAAGADGLGLEVNIDPPNEPSLAFHAKHGFVEVGRQMSHGIEVAMLHKPAR